MDRVSTLNLHNMTMASALNVQTQLAQAQVQQSSGLVSQDFGGLGGVGTQQMLNLETEINQAQTWAGEAQTVGYRTQAMYTALGNMTSSLSNLQQQISQVLAAPSTASLVDTVTSLQQSMLTQLNQQIGNRYLFAGSTIGTQPVSMTNYPTVQTNGSFKPTVAIASPSYYQGDSALLSVRVSAQQEITYGVTAANPAFEESLRAFQTILQGAQATANGTAGVSALTGTASQVGSAGSFTISGTGSATISYTAADTPATILQKINAQSGTTGVTGAWLKDTAGNYHLQLSSQGSFSTADVSGTLLNGTWGVATSATAPSRSQINASLQQALTTATQGLTDLSNLQASVAAVSKQLQDAQTQQTNFVTFLQNSLSNVKDVDAAQAASQVQLLQTQLQSSYMAVASITKINLAQYL